MAAVSRDCPGWWASRVVTRSVSDVEGTAGAPGKGSSPRSACCSAASRASSPVLIRFPLWASAMPPVAVERKVGWAFSQTLDPVVE